MTPPAFPPADQCSPEDLLAICEAIGRDPALSFDLAGSRAHIEAICRWAVGLAQDLSVAAANCADAALARDRLAQQLSEMTADRSHWKRRAIEAVEERDDLKVRCAHRDASRTRLGDLAADLLDDLSVAKSEVERLTRRVSHESRIKLERGAERDRVLADLDAARRAIAAREDEIARVNNERQAEINEAAAQRERADDAETAAELFETVARTMWAILARRVQADPPSLAELVTAVDGRLARALAREQRVTARLAKQVEDMALLLDSQRETREANDRLHSAFATAVPAICDGVTVEDLNHRLDEELAAHPDAGPLHHARDQRDHQEDTTP